MADQSQPELWPCPSPVSGSVMPLGKVGVATAPATVEIGAGVLVLVTPGIAVPGTGVLDWTAVAVHVGVFVGVLVAVAEPVVAVAVAVCVTVGVAVNVAVGCGVTPGASVLVGVGVGGAGITTSPLITVTA